MKEGTHLRPSDVRLSYGKDLSSPDHGWRDGPKAPQKLPQAKRGLAAAFELPQPSVVLDQKLLQDFVVSPLLSQRIHLMLWLALRRRLNC